MIPRGAVVTYVEHSGRLCTAVVVEPDAGRTTLVCDRPGGRKWVVPSHILTDTCERVDLPEPAPTCAACIAEADGTAAHLFAWELVHSCRLRGAA